MKTMFRTETLPVAVRESGPDRAREVRAAVDGLIARARAFDAARVDEERDIERARFQFD